MPDWNLNLSSDYDDAPTVVPSGCEAADRCDNCLRTDCPDCGREAVDVLCSNARAGTKGVLALGREILRIRRTGSDDGVTLGALARVRVGRPCHSSDAERRHACSWAEGVLAALDDGPALTAEDYEGDARDQLAHMLGWLLAMLHDARAYLWEGEAIAAQHAGREQRCRARRDRAAQTTTADIHRSPDPDMPWVYPSEFTPCTAADKAERLGITSAAGALSPTSRPTAPSGQRAESGPGLNSRAQHRGR